MFDQVDGSTSVQRSLSSTTSAASNEQPDTPADSNAGPQQCGVETVDSRPIETPPTSAPVTISTVSTGAFVPYTGPNQTNKPDLMDSKGSKLNIYDLLK